MSFKESVYTICSSLNTLESSIEFPSVVAIDGGSGAGKSTISEAVARELGAALVCLDDFLEIRISDEDRKLQSVPDRLQGVFDWERVRQDAILPLKAASVAKWRAFDFKKGVDEEGYYSLKSDFTEASPAPLVILAGSYSASPALVDLIDYSILLDVPKSERHRRTFERDELAFISEWHKVWDEVEEYYFGNLRPPEWFDLCIKNYD